MNLIIIIGPQAVGKMTVGEELAKQLDYKLFHNHMTIDMVMKLFTYEEGAPLIRAFRQQIFEHFLKSSNKGLIFTYVVAFDMESDIQYLEYLKTLYEEDNVYVVELFAPLETRLERNKTEDRLAKKWTKRNIEESEQRLKDTLMKHRVTSYDDELSAFNYIKIDNTKLSKEEVTSLILNRFKLKE